jgi:hypothetical protein
MSARQKLILIGGLVSVLLMFGSVFGWRETEISKSVPLPKKIQIIQPTGDLPKEIAAFSGRWEGEWEEGARQAKSVLIVEEINAAKAKVIYGWSGYGNVRADYSLFTAKVIPGIKPKIEFSSKFRDFSFEMGEDLKTIHGTNRPRKGVNWPTITMKKIEED